MKLNIKNIFIIIVVVMLTVISVLPLFAQEPPFTDESYYNNLCSGQSYGQKKEKCDEYKTYYKNKIEEANKELKEKKYELAEVKTNAEKYSKEYDALNLQVAELEKQIQTIKSGIKSTEAYITKLEKEIVLQEIEVGKKEEKVKEYIATSQSQTYTNTFVEFIMGAKDFSEVVSRMEGMTRIKEYNDEIIEELNLQKEQIEKDRQLAIDSVELMKVDEDIAEKKSVELDLKIAEARSLYKTFETMIAEIEAQSAAISQEIKLSNDQLSKLNDVVSTKGWYHALGSNRGRNTNWGFKYSGSLGGGFHNGADFGPGGAPIYAPGNGIVVVADKNDCGPGYLGNSCGNGWGNYVTMIVDVEGVIYGVSLAHMLNGSIVVSDKQVVTAGQRIGTVGTSGSSTGPHLHAEIYKLAETSLTDAVANFRDRRFGTGAGIGSRLCYRGTAAPCRVDAPLVWGDKKLTPGYYYGT